METLLNKIIVTSDFSKDFMVKFAMLHSNYTGTVIPLHWPSWAAAAVSTQRTGNMKWCSLSNEIDEEATCLEVSHLFPNTPLVSLFCVFFFYICIEMIYHWHDFYVFPSHKILSWQSAFISPSLQGRNCKISYLLERLGLNGIKYLRIMQSSYFV